MFIIQHLSARNWRRLASIDIEFHPLSNLLCGADDVGKTSILKCIIWCLGISTRVGGQGDIKDGSEETEATLTIGINGPDGVVRSHTINRRLNRKGAASIKIDDAKVSVADGLRILTTDWGLPHPEQLIEMIWMRQQRLDALIREEPSSRQERFAKVLGLQSLKALNGPLERVITQFNNSANAERALGTDPREIAAEADNIEIQRQRLATQVASFPSADQTRANIQALRDAVIRIEASDAAKKASVAVNSLAAVLAPWIADVAAALNDSKLAPAPDIARIGDFATALADVASLRQEQAARSTEIGRFPTTPRLQAEIEAVRSEAIRIEWQSAQALADAARRDLPAELATWIDSALASKPVPAIERLGDFARTRQDLAGVGAKIAEVGSPDRLRAETSALEHWLAEQALKAASEAATIAITSTPTVTHPWANLMRTELARTRALPNAVRIAEHRKAGVTTANAVCETNAKNHEATAHNARRTEYLRALTTVLGPDAPNAEMRATLRQFTTLSADLARLGEALGLGTAAAGTAGQRLYGIMASVTRSALATRVPKKGAASGSALSPQAEAALRTLWNELNSSTAITRCPLTNDAFTPGDVATARAAQAERESRAFASTQWKAFVDSVTSEDTEVATLLKQGAVVAALDLIRSATAEVNDVKTSGLAPVSSRFWLDARARASFLQLHKQVAGLESNIPKECRAWLADAAACAGDTEATYLDQIRALEETIAAHGTEKPIQGALFELASDPHVHAAQDALLAEDAAAIKVATLVKPPLGSFTSPASIEAAISRQTEIAAALGKLPALLGEHKALSTSLDQLQRTLFASPEGPTLYADLIRAVAIADAAPRLATLANTAIAQIRSANTLHEKVAQLPVWNTDFGIAPSTAELAATKLASLQQQATDRAAVQQRLAIATEGLARAEETTSRLRRSVFVTNGQVERYAELIKTLGTTPNLTADLAKQGEDARTALTNAKSLNEAASRLPVWDETFGNAPVSVELAKARLTTLEQEASELAALQGKLGVLEQSLLRLRENIERMTARAAGVERVETIRDRFRTIERFLQPENGPRVLTSQQYMDIITRANEVLELIGADRWLVGNENFELFTGSPEQGDALHDAAETGGSKGNLCGIAMALGLLEHYNAGTNGCGVGTMFIDEPTICVRKDLVPSLLGVLTSKGRRMNQQTILVEHEPSSKAYVDKVITIT